MKNCLAPCRVACMNLVFGGMLYVHLTASVQMRGSWELMTLTFFPILSTMTITMLLLSEQLFCTSQYTPDLKLPPFRVCSCSASWCSSFVCLLVSFAHLSSFQDGLRFGSVRVRTDCLEGLCSKYAKAMTLSCLPRVFNSAVYCACLSQQLLAKSQEDTISVWRNTGPSILIQSILLRIRRFACQGQGDVIIHALQALEDALHHGGVHMLCAQALQAQQQHPQGAMAQ